jgi:hypothetical protein
LTGIFECDIASLQALEEAADSPKGQNRFKRRHAAYYGCKHCEKGGRMKKMYAPLLLCLCPFCAYAQSTYLSLGSFSFFLSSKILEDGSITDVGAGLDYAGRFRGELRLRNTISSKNESTTTTKGGGLSGEAPKRGLKYLPASADFRSAYASF